MLNAVLRFDSLDLIQGKTSSKNQVLVFWRFLCCVFYVLIILCYNIYDITLRISQILFHSPALRVLASKGIFVREINGRYDGVLSVYR